jgi:AMP-binding enzyme
VDFGLNEDQEAFQAAVRAFAREKLAPGYLARAQSERFPWDVHYVQGLWRPELLFELLDASAGRAPDALAVADQHERLTYRELAERSKALAGWLVEQDVPAGSVVAVQTGNRAALAVAHFACSRADLTFVPLSTQWRKTELESLLRRSGVSVLVVPPPRKDVDFMATVEAMRADLPRLRRLPPRGRRAARPGAGRVHGGPPGPGLRADDRLGAGGPAGFRGRPRVPVPTPARCWPSSG